MAFITDQQTTDDLALFSKSGEDSVYSLFSVTRTAGGAVLLKEMFAYPISDAKKINERAGIIRELSEQNSAFPFNTELVTTVQHYLEDTEVRSVFTTENRSLGKKLADMIAVDTNYHLIRGGVGALVQILPAIYSFLNHHAIGLRFAETEAGKEAKTVLETEFPGEFITNAQGRTLGHAQIAEYDQLFRFRKKKAVYSLLKFVYLVDVYYAAATVARQKEFGFPLAVAGKAKLRIIKAYHPLLSAKPVANSVSLTDTGNIIFLTGANMAGKSTFMKTLGLVVYLAHMGFPVPAAEVEFVPLDGVYTTINLPDQLTAGSSHFYTEVLRLKKIAKELNVGKNLLILFDELFRGTNVKDAHEGTIAVISAFSERKSAFFVISTHIIEAGEELQQRGLPIQFLYMPTLAAGEKMVYPYTLCTGITADRHGMMIIRREGILDILN